MSNVAIVDVGIGNLRSVQKAIERAALDRAQTSVQAIITGDPARIAKADRVVFPGQGAYRLCSLSLGQGIGEAVREQIKRGTPYLGICLGLQTLFDSSEEAPGHAGLGWLSGTNVRLADGARDPASGERIKIPHMGWNALELRGGGHPLLAAAGGEGTHVYFVHSYHGVPNDRSVIAAVVRHGPYEITAAVAKDNVFATQFHPEKSQGAGLALLGAFLDW